MKHYHAKGGVVEEGGSSFRRPAAGPDLDELRERLTMARTCLAAGEHWRSEQAENQAMRHLDCALAMLNGDADEGAGTDVEG